MSFSDAADRSSVLPRLGIGHCRGENTKNKKFLVWSILDRLCFTNMRRPYVLPNNFRHTTHKRRHFRKLDGISLLFVWSDRPSQPIIFCYFVSNTHSPVQRARNLTQDFNSSLLILQNYSGTHQLLAVAVTPKRRAVLSCRADQSSH